MCLATEDSYFILQVDTGAITAAIEAKQGFGEDGLEEGFDVSSQKRSWIQFKHLNSIFS